jgi:tetratricopeptide (TPR) repeat protein/DNA-binding CsgD family transcriptional regulator
MYSKRSANHIRINSFQLVVFLLLSFTSFNGWAQSEIDSLRTLLKTAKGTQRIDVMNMLGSYVSTIDIKESDSLLSASYALARKENYANGEAKAMLLIATNEGRAYRIARADSLMDKAYALSKKVGYLEGIDQAMIGKGALRLRMGHHAEALEIHLKGLMHAQRSGNKEIEVVHLANIANVKEALGEFDQAEYYLKKALDKCTKEGLRYREMHVYINIALLHYRRHNLGLSIEYNAKALAIAEELNDSALMSVALSNLGFADAMLGKKQGALTYYDRSLELRRRMNDPHGIAVVLMYKSKLFREDAPALSRKLAEEALQTGRQNNDLPLMREVLTFLYEDADKHKETASALGYLKALVAVKDSLDTQSDKLNMARMEANLAMQELLRQNEMTLRDKEINTLQVRQRNILIFGLAFLVLLLAAVVVLVRLRMRQRLLHEEQNKHEALRKVEVLNHQLSDEKQRLLEFTEEMALQKSKSDAAPADMESVRELPDLSKVVASLSAGITHDKDWTAFNLLFEAAYPTFVEKLRGRYGDFTYNDLRLAALIKVRLSNKEIADILHISRESVVRAKYRLRQRMGLESYQEMEGMLAEL